ncbi:MAG: tetratricopeptide repeat protein [Kiritimatiellia bacterium]|jgi:TolA-binding protein
MKQTKRMARLAGTALAIALAGTARAADAGPVQPPVEAAAPVHEPVMDESSALANGLFSRGLFDLAAAEYAALLARDPAPADSDTLAFRLGECHRRSERTAEANEAYRKAAAIAPRSASGLRARLQLGLSDLESGKPAEAAPGLQALAADAASDPSLRIAALFYAAEAYAASGDTALATTDYAIVREIAPDSETADYATLRLAAIQAAGDDASVATARAACRELVDRPAAPRIAAEALYQLAQIAEARNEPDEAAARFLELMASYPEDARAKAARLRAAWACFDAGRFSDARRLADEALAASAADAQAAADALYLRANAERQLELRAEALADYAELLEKHPDSRFATSARYERILTLHRDSRHADALAEGDRFENPPDELLDDLLWILAESAAAIPDPAEAVQRYRMLLRRTPDSPFAPQAFYRLARLLQDQESWAEASATYLELCAAFPDHALVPRALFASGICLSRAGQGDAAIRDWQTLVQRFPDDETVPEALYQRAMEDLRAQRSADAADALDELLRRFPDHIRRPDALFWRGVIHHQGEDNAEATRLLRDALAANPSRDIELEATYLLGAIAQSQGRTDEAAALFQPLLDSTAREKFPPERLAWLSEFQFDRGEHAAAASAAQTLRDTSDDPVWKQTAWVLLARASRASGDTAAAIDALEQALALGVNGRFAPEAALRLGESLLEQGKTDEAEARLRNAVERAATPEFLDVRARATAALGRTAEARGDKETAIRYHFAVAILYDDAQLVPAALDRAAALLAELGRAGESAAAANELVERYPEAPQAKAWKERLAGKP